MSSLILQCCFVTYIYSGEHNPSSVSYPNHTIRIQVPDNSRHDIHTTRLGHRSLAIPLSSPILNTRISTYTVENRILTSCVLARVINENRRRWSISWQLLVLNCVVSATVSRSVNWVVARYLIFKRERILHWYVQLRSLFSYVFSLFIRRRRFGFCLSEASCPPLSVGSHIPLDVVRNVSVRLHRF